MSFVPQAYANPTTPYYVVAGEAPPGVAQVLSLSGDTIALSGGGGSVNVATATTVADVADKTTAQSYVAGFDSTQFTGEIIAGGKIESATPLGGTATLNGGLSEVQIGGTLAQPPKVRFEVNDQPDGVITYTGATFTFNPPLTDSDFQTLSILDYQLSISGGNTVNLPNPQTLDISGNQLSISEGNTITLPVDGVQTLSAGSNISVDNTDPANPIVAVAISSTLDMSGQAITNAQAVELNDGGSITATIDGTVPSVGLDNGAGNSYSIDCSTNIIVFTGATASSTQTPSGITFSDGSNVIDINASASPPTIEVNNGTSLTRVSCSNITLRDSTPAIYFQDISGIPRASLNYAELTDKITTTGANITLETDALARVLLNATTGIEVRTDNQDIKLNRWDATGVVLESSMTVGSAGVFTFTSGANSVVIDASVPSVSGATIGLDANGNLKLGDTTTGASPTGNNAVAIGVGAGSSAQAMGAVAIGANAGQTSQSNFSVAIGIQTGQTNQSFDCVAVGVSAGNNGQGMGAVAVGSASGLNAQGENTVAVGLNSGRANQGARAMAIGYNSGYESQGADAISIGANTGTTADFQGAYAICIGSDAHAGYQPANSILINATGAPVALDSVAGFYVAPVRATPAYSATLKSAFYDTATAEITYGDTFPAITVQPASGTIALTPEMNRSTYILTGIGATQTFTSAGLVGVPAGWCVYLRNGNNNPGTDITISINGTASLHANTTNNNSGGVLLYWDGSAIVKYL